MSLLAGMHFFPRRFFRRQLTEDPFSVDIETDRAMQNIIREDFKDRTIIAVAHRLETILDFDRVVVLDSGCLVEDGSPSQLLNRNSAFKRLYDVYRNERNVDNVAQ
jgi:ATP-binding cassette subfamily C (CFTR/MRP) protein 1